MIDNTNYLVLGLGGSWILQVEAAAPGRCGSFTGAWFHPRSGRSALSVQAPGRDDYPLFVTLVIYSWLTPNSLAKADFRFLSVNTG